MKRNDLAEVKSMDVKALAGRVKKLKEEVLELVIDKNMSKMADLKSIDKKRKEIAQILTVMRQKELLGQLEAEAEKGSK